jgi:hypothetical protein
LEHGVIDGLAPMVRALAPPVDRGVVVPPRAVVLLAVFTSSPVVRAPGSAGASDPLLGLLPVPVGEVLPESEGVGVGDGDVDCEVGDGVGDGVLEAGGVGDVDGGGAGEVMVGRAVGFGEHVAAFGGLRGTIKGTMISGDCGWPSGWPAAEVLLPEGVDEPTDGLDGPEPATGDMTAGTSMAM